MAADCEKVKPFGSDDTRQKSEQVREMFDGIAPAYDFMNHAMTMGVDKWWRRCAVKRLSPLQPRYILDVATGTGDLAMLMARRLDPVSIIGVDLSEGMIEVGRGKIDEAGLADVITLQQADSLQLPFPSNRFDCVTVAYGVRNFENLLAGYAEMFRVLRPGGRLVVLELATPRSPLVKPLYDLYAGKVIPWMGRMVSHTDHAYAYLPESIAAVPQREAMAELMKQAGFDTVTFRSYTFGTCILYVADKATAPAPTPADEA